jgi:hypothetical protein
MEPHHRSSFSLSRSPVVYFGTAVRWHDLPSGPSTVQGSSQLPALWHHWSWVLTPCSRVSPLASTTRCKPCAMARLTGMLSPIHKTPPHPFGQV